MLKKIWKFITKKKKKSEQSRQNITALVPNIYYEIVYNFKIIKEILFYIKNIFNLY